jgi:hypothetical protein
MALAFIAATMLVSTVIVDTLDLFDDAEAGPTRTYTRPTEAKIVVPMVINI